MPDIFVNGGGTDFANWTDLLVDMSDQEWASDTDAAYIDEKQGTIGFPYTTEAIGLTYNKDILDKAGIDPSTLTGPDAIQKAFETLDSKKDELGLQRLLVMVQNRLTFTGQQVTIYLETIWIQVLREMIVLISICSMTADSLMKSVLQTLLNS